jgi:c-di-GMP-binding flagellar brake protein YcgR
LAAKEGWAMFTERRKVPRVSVTCKISTSYAERLLVFNTHTEDLSEGGMKVILEQNMHTPTPVNIELFLGPDKAPFVCKGEVLWVKEVIPEGAVPRMYETGIKFTGLSGEDKDKLRNALAIFAKKK